MPILKANGGDIYYEAIGDELAPPIVFANALGATTDMWRELTDILSRRFRCIVFDANGHGRSPFTAKPATIETLAGDLAGVVDGLGLSKATVVGASIGAMTAIAHAAGNPGGIGDLVLIGATPKMPEGKIWTDRASEARRDGLGKIANAAMGRWFTAGYAADHGGRIDEIRGRFLEVDTEAYARGCEAIAEMDLGPAMRRVGARCLIVAGAEDTGAPPATGETIRRAIADATLLVMPGVAHMIAIERAPELGAWIAAFLADVVD
jgi:3-oxoadipate enol-lactonase/3-oxoadipate enol-lactonase/4-carboxymuconolactone decarboxylase